MEAPDYCAYRVLFCSKCNMTFLKWEKASDYKDESGFVCEACSEPKTDTLREKEARMFVKYEGKYGGGLK